MLMKDAKFEREIKHLLYFIREYGIHRVGFSLDEKQNDPEKIAEFVSKVHQGFNVAQTNVILNLTCVLQEKKKNKVAIKEANIAHDKEKVRELQQKQKKLKYQEYAFRKIMDSLAWLFLNRDISSIRRLYFGHPPIDITDSNIAYCQKVVQDLFADDHTQFPLISDLTTFVQVGDIMISGYNKGITLLELKEGDVNEKIEGIIDAYRLSKCDRYLQLSLEKESAKFQEQFFRVVNQMKKGNDVLKTINTGKGIDQFSGQPIEIIQRELEFSCFDSVVADLMKKSRERGYAISVVEGCLLIGVYESSRFDSRVFDVWAQSENIKTPIYDARQSLLDPMLMPLYLLPLSDPDIIDIVVGKKILRMAIDINSWLKPLEKNGVEIRWISHKETAETKRKTKNRQNLIEIGGHGIEIIKDDYSQVLARGMVARMFSMLYTPSSMREYIMATFDHMRTIDASK